MHRVVMVLGVRRIDGDERHVAPILAALQRRGPGFFGLGKRFLRKRHRDFVGVDRDQADRLFRLDRAEPFLHPRGSEAEGAGADQIHADEIAVLRMMAIGLRDVELAPGLLAVDRDEPAAAVGEAAKDAEDAALAVIDDLDDAAAIGCAFAFIRRLDAQQHAIADAAGLGGPCLARQMDADLRRFAVLDLVPFGGRGDQFAVAVAAGDVGHHSGRQRCGLADLATLLLDGAIVGELAQQALELGAIGVFQPELAGDLLGPELAGIVADEGDNGLAIGKAIVRNFLHRFQRAFPALFFASVLGVVAGLAADVLAAFATGARALLMASDFGLAAAFLTVAFLAGFGASASSAAPALAVFAAFATLAAGFALALPLALPPPLAARSSISAIACSSVRLSFSNSAGIVALTPPAVT